MTQNEILKINIRKAYKLPKNTIDRELINLLLKQPYSTITKIIKIYSRTLPYKDPETLRRHLKKLSNQQIAKRFTINYVDEYGLTNADQDTTELTTEEREAVKQALIQNDMRSGGFKDKPGMNLDIYWITTNIQKIIDEENKKT